MSRQAKRERAKARRRDRLAQAEADREVREEWLAAVHGEAEHLELLVADRHARAAVLRDPEVPAGVTDSMLRAACLRALESM